MLSWKPIFYDLHYQPTLQRCISLNAAAFVFISILKFCKFVRSWWFYGKWLNLPIFSVTHFYSLNTKTYPNLSLSLLKFSKEAFLKKQIPLVDTWVNGIWHTLLNFLSSQEQLPENISLTGINTKKRRKKRRGNRDSRLICKEINWALLEKAWKCNTFYSQYIS